MLIQARRASLQWGSETGSRRRKLAGVASLSHTISVPFNGAPRLGLGEGHGTPLHPPATPPPSMGLRDWVSEKAADKINAEIRAMTLQWGSETGSRRRRAAAPTPTAEAPAFNGAPRLGLGEGHKGVEIIPEDAGLQWGSETGSRRRRVLRGQPPRHPRPSMGLRDWVSEKGECSELSRRRRIPSMGLRDWVSEKAIHQVHPPSPLRLSFNGAPRLGLGEGRGSR